MLKSGSGSVSRGRSVVAPLVASVSSFPRRVNHGGAAWLGRRGLDLRQPQDGAPYVPEVESAATRARFEEAEQARITGGTRSLVSRLMGLNVASVKDVRTYSSVALHPLLPRQHPRTA